MEKEIKIVITEKDNGGEKLDYNINITGNQEFSNKDIFDSVLNIEMSIYDSLIKQIMGTLEPGTPLNNKELTEALKSLTDYRTSILRKAMYTLSSGCEELCDAVAPLTFGTDEETKEQE